MNIIEAIIAFLVVTLAAYGLISLYNDIAGPRDE